MAKKGRPTSYSTEIADAVCEEIATTDHSLAAICSRDGMSSQSMVYRWLEAHEDFRERYARATTGPGISPRLRTGKRFRITSTSSGRA
jgi:hypothetical protein